MVVGLIGPPQARCVGLLAVDDDHAQVAHVRIGGTGLKKRVQWFEPVVGVVAPQVIIRIESTPARFGKHLRRDERARRIGRTIFAIGSP